MKSRRANSVKIGAFVVVGLAILVAAVLLIGSGHIFRRTISFVSYFEGSVNGLRAGASVKFKGVELGKVTRIRIPYWLARTDPPIAVFYALDGDKLDDVEEGPEPSAGALRGAIRNGLRAELETDSFVTGVLHVSLLLLPESEARLHDPVEGVMEIPTLPTPQQEIGAAVRSLVDRLSRYEFERLFDSLRNALDGVSELSRGPELRGALSSLDQTLQELGKLIHDVDPLANQLLALAQRADALGSELQAGVGSARVTLESLEALSNEVNRTVGPLASSLIEASDRLQAMAAAMQSTLESTRVLLDPRAPIPVELHDAVRELADTARSARLLFELLERDPAVLLYGKGAQKANPR